jgi:hypothetical protein
LTNFQNPFYNANIVVTHMAVTYSTDFDKPKKHAHKFFRSNCVPFLEQIVFPFWNKSCSIFGTLFFPFLEQIGFPFWNKLCSIFGTNCVPFLEHNFFLMPYQIFIRGNSSSVIRFVSFFSYFQQIKTSTKILYTPFL